MSDIIRPEDFQTFTFDNGAELRVIIEEGEPLFYAKDVCDALGYERARDAIAQHCKSKGAVKRDTLTKGGKQEVTYIDESNVYRLIMRSKLPKAEEFQDWVCGEVLPTIRKTGKYERKEGQDAIQLTQGTIYRANELRRWLYLHGYYNHRKEGTASFLPVKLIHSSLESIGFIYKDTKSRKWVATTYALEKSFCVNVPVKQFVTFNHDGTVKKTTTQYAFAVTEAGAEEYTHELRRFAKKYNVMVGTQTKLIGGKTA